MRRATIQPNQINQISGDVHKTVREQLLLREIENLKK